MGTNVTLLIAEALGVPIFRRYFNLIIDRKITGKSKIQNLEYVGRLNFSTLLKITYSNNSILRSHDWIMVTNYHLKSQKIMPHMNSKNNHSPTSSPYQYSYPSIMPSSIWNSHSTITTIPPPISCHSPI